MARVVIGMDPHKRSATIEIINSREQVHIAELVVIDKRIEAATAKLRELIEATGSSLWPDPDS